jgi:hypothetical protein
VLLKDMGKNLKLVQYGQGKKRLEREVEEVNFIKVHYIHI